MRQFIIRDATVRSHFIKWLMGQTLSKPLDVKVKDWSKPRTNPQNARLWKLHTMASEVTGATPDQMHEDCCCDYFGSTDIKMPSGAIQRKPRRTTTKNEAGEHETLDPKEFNKFMEWCEMRYIEMLGIWLDQAA